MLNIQLTLPVLILRACPVLMSLIMIGCGGSSEQNNSGQTINTPTAESTPASPTTGETEPSTQVSSPGDQSPQNYCDQFQNQSDAFFCEDFSQTSPVELVGRIAPMSFRDQTYREYTRGELFELDDPDESSRDYNVLNLHTDLVDGQDFSVYAGNTAAVSAKWDITAHSRDGYISPGTGAGSNDEYWWNETFLMGDHSARCAPPPDLEALSQDSPSGERAYTFMEQFFDIPDSYNGDENQLAPYWSAEFEQPLQNSAGIHPIVRYEDMIYVCADHLMTAAYATGAAKLSLTPNFILDTTAGEGVVEFSVSTYRTAGRDYWQVDLTPIETHLQLPEGDVVADANGKAFNGFAINTQLDEGANGVIDLLGGINVFLTLMLKNNRFIENGSYYSPQDPNAEFKRAQIANPGNPERLEIYAQAPQGENWVITHSSYNQVMYDYLRGSADDSVTLHNVTDNRTRARFRLTVKETPDIAAWAAEPELWDQVSLCMPDYGGGCVGDYIVPELPEKLLVQFTHYAYNTTKSCAQTIQQPHDIPGAAFQSICHPNTYHWDNFYVSPGKSFSMIRATERTYRHNGNSADPLRIEFDAPAPANSKLRFNALTGGTSNEINGVTTLQISYDSGATWHTPSMQPEPENNFDKFRSYFTGMGQDQSIPVGTQSILVRAQNPGFREAFWIREASFWSGSH